MAQLLSRHPFWYLGGGVTSANSGTVFSNMVFGARCSVTPFDPPLTLACAAWFLAVGAWCIVREVRGWRR